MSRRASILVSMVALVALAGWPAAVGAKPRARELGVPFEGEPGPLNAITDVAGVTVGHETLIAGEGPLVVGRGPVRTGVTAVLPRGERTLADPVFAGWFALNGNGEMTGTTWVEESGFLSGPVMITNTHSVGVVHDAVISWFVEQAPRPLTDSWSLPVVAETWDGFLNDINGFHVRPEHALRALGSARGGGVAEGGVGGGTGMVCYGFKGGIGTSSRRVEAGGERIVGVLVQANFGRRHQLRVAGVPVGLEITEQVPYAARIGPGIEPDVGSIIVVVATDAPLLPHQLERLARRASLGVARTGGTAMNGSGDIFIAFSTANPGAASTERPAALEMLPNEWMDPLIAATVEATEEAIVNALVAAEPMRGRDDHFVPALPHDRLREVLDRHGRLAAPAGTR